jgi:hypothetical protein
MVLVTATACCLGVCRVLGLVPGTFFVALILCYLLASFLSLRTRVICAACSSFLALFDWYDQVDVAMVFSGVDDRLPIISLPRVLSAPLSVFSFLAEFPLRCIAASGDQFYEVIFVDFAPFLRPNAVFVFWMGLALAFGLSVGTSLVAAWRSGPFRHPRGLPNI